VYRKIALTWYVFGNTTRTSLVPCRSTNVCAVLLLVASGKSLDDTSITDSLESKQPGEMVKMQVDDDRC
jgi:hypothetical protein